MMKKLAVTLLIALPLHAMADVSVREVAGINLGMSLSDAEKLLEERTDGVVFARDNRVFARPSNSELVVSSLPPNGDTAVSIDRRVEYSSISGRLYGDPVDLQSTIDAYISKYGEPDELIKDEQHILTNYIFKYVDFVGDAPEDLKISGESFKTLFHGGSVSYEVVDAVDTYMEVVLTEYNHSKGKLGKMEVELLDVATQRDYLKGILAEQEKAKEAEARRLEAATTTADI